MNKLHEQTADLVIKSYYYNEEFLYAKEFNSFSKWSDALFARNFRTSLQEVVKEALAKKSGVRDGIIPDIDLSIKMPKGLRYIIGEGGHISVDGSQSISLDVSRNQTPSLLTQRQSAFPQIKLEQRLKARIHGTVGEKIHVSIDHDSEAREQDNKLKIWYEGNEDDIIQTIDAGDIKGLRGGRNQNVFGIQTSGAVGSTRFDLTAGKLESNTASKSESFSISSDSTTLYERNYVKDEYYYTGMSQEDSLISLSLFIEGNEINGTPTELIDIEGNYLGVTYFKEMDYGEDYELRYLRLSGGRLFPYLRVSKVHYDKRLGIWYEYYDKSGDSISHAGNIPVSGDTLTLVQIRSRNPTNNEPSWELQMRNIYSFGITSATELDVTIYKVVSGGDDLEIDPQSNKEYIELLGLDSDGNGSIDPEQVLWADGSIIFPAEKPFLNPVLGNDTVSSIYRKQSLLDDEGKNYRIVLNAVSSKKEFFIGQGSLVDSSEVVIVDGDTLSRGLDYNIDYNTGRVVFTENANLTSDSRVSYTYDTEPLFSFTSRYLARTNVSMNPMENSDLNLNLEFQSSSNPDPHPRVGMEPSHIARGKINFSTERQPEIINNVFRSLPFVGNESNSKIKINGSYGFSLPNPASNGKSYLDDMESLKLSRELELGAGLWNYCSQPESDALDSIVVDENIVGEIDWFNSRIPKVMLYPELPTSQRSQYLSTMSIYFRPNQSAALIEDSWAGLMKAFTVEENFSQKKYLEVWVKGEEGELFIELGSRMKEDIIRWARSTDGTDSLIVPNGKIDTEDRNGNFSLEPGEDTGLDGIAFDDDKWSYVPDSLDDGRDDYPDNLTTFEDSIKMHRKEGNRRLDSEDLNKDHMLELYSDYYSYRIDLSSSELVANYGNGGWRMYRIPLKDSLYYTEYGNPSFENLLYSRIWLRGVDSDTRISIAKVSVVGSKWIDKGVRSYQGDSLSNGGKFLITYRNSYENEDYIPPVERERELYGEGYEREQSMVLKIDSLQQNNYCLAQYYLELPKSSSGRGYDLRLYKILRFYSKVESSISDSVMIFLRMLTDSSNYYQYSTYIRPSDWDTLDVDFQEFYNLKLENDTLRGNYSVKGKPTMMSIAYLHVGVMNPNSSNFNGDVYFNDIILLDANKDMGSNLDLNLSTNLGDFINNISYHIKRQSDNYKSNLNQLRNIGDREIISHNFDLKANTGKLLNGFLSMPVSYSFSNQSQIPSYRKNSDIILPDDKREEESIRNNSRRVVVNISRPSQSKFWLLKYTIDRIRINGSYSLSQNFSPRLTADTVVSKTASVNYNLPLPSVSPPILSDNSTSLLPLNISMNANYNNRIQDKYRYSNEDSTFQKTNIKPVKNINASGGFSYKPIRWVNINYNISGKNDMLYGDRYGQNVRLTERVTANHNSNQFGINRLSLTYTSTFSQNHEVDYSRTLGDTLDVRSASQSRRISINDNFEISKILEKIPVLSTFADNLNTISFSSSFSRDISYAYLNSIPDYRFRYGIEQTVADYNVVQNNPSDGGAVNRQFNVSTGINISRIRIDLSGSYSESKPDELKISNSVSASKTINMSFPDVNIRIPDVDKFIPFLDGVIRDSRLDISILRDSSNTVSLMGQDFSKGSASLKLTPTLDLKFNNGLNITVKSGYNVTNQYSDRTYDMRTRSRSQDINIDASYSIRPGAEGFSLPLLGKVKWDSPIDLKASFSIQNNKEISMNRTTGKEEINRDNRNIIFKLSGDYNFSRMVSGGLSFNYRNYLNRKITDDETTSYGGNFHILFRF